MSSLVADRTGALRWFEALGLSAVLHTGAVLGGLGVIGSLQARTNDYTPEQDFTITIQQLDTALVSEILTARPVEEAPSEGDETLPDETAEEAQSLDEELAALDELKPETAPEEEAEPVAEAEAEEAVPEAEPEEPVAEAEAEEAIPEAEPEEPVAEAEPETPPELTPEPEPAPEEIPALESVEEPASPAVENAALEQVAVADIPELPEEVAAAVETAAAETATIEPTPEIAPAPIAPESPLLGSAVAEVSNAVTLQSLPQEVAVAAPVETQEPEPGTPSDVVAVAAAEETAPALIPLPEPEEPEQTAPPPAPSPATPQRTPRRPVTEQDRRLGGLIGRIRSDLTDSCLLALPTRAEAGGIGVSLISDSATAMEAFASRVLDASLGEVVQTRTQVDSRQCDAMLAVRQNNHYPATRVALKIDRTEVPSGDRLAGLLRGASGKALSLVLIDDNGVLHDLDRFITVSGALARFDVPIARLGPARDTRLMLVAIASDAPLPQIAENDGQYASDVFAALPADQIGGADLAISMIDVR